MRPTGRYDAQVGISLVKYDLRTELCRHEGWLDPRSPFFYPKCQQPSSWSCTLDSAARSTAAHSTVTSQDTRMAMTLTGYRASPTACRRRHRPVPAGGTEDEIGPNAGHAPRCEIPGRPRVLPPDGLVIPSGGPLAAAWHTGRAAGMPVKGRECATAQGSEVEDRGRAPTELAARYSGATRTQPHEPS